MVLTNEPTPIAMPEAFAKAFVALAGIDVYFMQLSKKMSKKMRMESRVVLILRDQVYSCYPDGDITHFIRIPTIGSLCVKDDDIVVRVPGDQDLWVRMPDRSTTRRMIEVLSSLHYLLTGNNLTIQEVPAHLQLGCPQYPVQLQKPGKNSPIYLDPITQQEPPLAHGADDAATTAAAAPVPAAAVPTAVDMFRQRGSVPPPPEDAASDAGYSGRGAVLAARGSVPPPPPPPQDDDESEVDALTGLATAGHVVTSGTHAFPTIELASSANDGVTAGIITLTPEQLASAQGGPLKINLQIKTLHGEASQASSRASSTPATIPPPPSCSPSTAYSCGDLQDDDQAPAPAYSHPSHSHSHHAPHEQPQPPQQQPSVVSQHSSAAPPPSAPASSVPRNQDSYPAAAAAATASPATAAATSAPASSRHATPAAVAPQVAQHSSAVPQQQHSAAPPPPPAAEAPPAEPLGDIKYVEVPNADGSYTTVPVPEASLPSVHAMVRQIQDAQDTLKKKDQQLSAVLSLTQRSSGFKRERTDDKIQELSTRNHHAEAELEALKAELRATKGRVVAEKEAYLADLAMAAGPPQAHAAPLSYANYSPGGRVMNGGGSPAHIHNSRVSPMRQHRESPRPAAFSQGRAKRQYSHSPVPAVEPESDWAMMTRLCQDIGQRLDGTKVTQSPRATERKGRLVSQFSPLPNLSSPIR
eukprot:Rhum_TRINITY_DN10110_c0_g1::Rhum_TRINITY_DN10110_c0_g1_i1::g.36886::m.36886